jgi:hypothetical protein
MGISFQGSGNKIVLSIGYIDYWQGKERSFRVGEKLWDPFISP